MKKLILLLFIPLLSFSQEILNNQSVIDMIQLGFVDQVIIDKIESTNSDFDTSIETMKLLKESGASPSILSAMIKASKQSITEAPKEEKTASPPKPDDTSFYWQNGKGELVEVAFLNSLVTQYELDEYEIAGYIQRIMMEVTIGLKSKLSFVPQTFMIRERYKSDKFLTNNDKTTHIAQLGYTATNSYGGMVEGVKLIGINPTLVKKEIENQSSLEDNSEKTTYYFSQMIGEGMNVKVKGRVIISEKSLIINYDEYGSMGGNPIPIENREILGENHWRNETIEKGTKLVLEYDGNERKYKTNGGVLKLYAIGSETIFPLTIIEN